MWNPDGNCGPQMATVVVIGEFLLGRVFRIAMNLEVDEVFTSPTTKADKDFCQVPHPPLIKILERNIIRCTYGTGPVMEVKARETLTYVSYVKLVLTLHLCPSPQKILHPLYKV